MLDENRDFNDAHHSHLIARCSLLMVNMLFNMSAFIWSFRFDMVEISYMQGPFPSALLVLTHPHTHSTAPKRRPDSKCIDNAQWREEIAPVRAVLAAVITPHPSYPSDL